MNSGVAGYGLSLALWPASRSSLAASAFAASSGSVISITVSWPLHQSARHASVGWISRCNAPVPPNGMFLWPSVFQPGGLPKSNNHRPRERLRLLRLAGLLSLLAFSVRCSAGVHAVAFALIVPGGPGDRANDQHQKEQQEPPSIRHFHSPFRSDNPKRVSALRAENAESANAPALMLDRGRRLTCAQLSGPKRKHSGPKQATPGKVKGRRPRETRRRFPQ
jgi:hypothetical protein